MLNIVSVLCLPAALIVLGALCLIDLKVRLLPNRLVLCLAILGLGFHAASQLYYTNYSDMFWGALTGGGLLYLIRFAGNYFYKQDTLGLGDVKLMAAGGLWLGADGILSALIIGAIAGLLHGGIVIGHSRLTKKDFGPLSTFSIPAGPGFIAGLLIVALVKFKDLPHLGF
ncbi:MAG: prepilin peptidase [Alphaproteobacteria bacterium]|nr:prepilin peptidase [Alphaproteobacteria bacterium]